MMSRALPGKERAKNISGKEEITCTVLAVRDYGLGGNTEHRARGGNP